MASKDTYSVALNQNKTWAKKTASDHPDLFPALANGQQPQILWIGCSDSRVPETTVLGLQPGDVFVHRNIANILHPGDLNALSVITYAVVYLKVQDIVVCGHTSCGGANAALGNQKLGVLDAWLLPLRALRKQHAKQWEALDAKEKITKLVEANVRQGVQTLRENADVIDAMRERGLKLHGLVYDVGCGELKELEVDESEDECSLRMSAFETGAEGKKEEKEKEVSVREK